jgi:hypothetical protein
MARNIRTSEDTPKAPPPEPEIEVKGNGVAEEEESLDDYIVADDGTAPGSDNFDNLEKFALPQDFNPDVEEEDPRSPAATHLKPTSSASIPTPR